MDAYRCHTYLPAICIFTRVSHHVGIGICTHGQYIREAVAKRIDCIAICDHNSGENAPFVEKAAYGSPVKVFVGMEITSREEVHIVALFDNLSALRSLQESIYQHLAGQNDEKRFGYQVIVNECDEVEGICERLLIGATDLSVTSVVEAIHEREGVAIAAHIDRESFSVIGQLGFISPEMQFDALEISSHLSLPEARRRFPELSQWPMITSSDAHYLRDMGRSVTRIVMEEPTIQELKWAFRKEEGRYICEHHD